MNSSGGAFGSLFRRSKKEETNEESRGAGGGQTVSEEAKKKAQAAKEYIEKVRHPADLPRGEHTFWSHLFRPSDVPESVSKRRREE